MPVTRGFHQLDERQQKSPCFDGVVGCARLLQQPVNRLLKKSGWKDGVPTTIV